VSGSVAKMILLGK